MILRKTMFTAWESLKYWLTSGSNTITRLVFNSICCSPPFSSWMVIWCGPSATYEMPCSAKNWAVGIAWANLSASSSGISDKSIFLSSKSREELLSFIIRCFSSRYDSDRIWFNKYVDHQNNVSIYQPNCDKSNFIVIKTRVLDRVRNTVEQFNSFKEIDLMLFDVSQPLAFIPRELHWSKYRSNSIICTSHAGRLV